jgi:hypothetical protein
MGIYFCLYVRAAERLGRVLKMEGEGRRLVQDLECRCIITRVIWGFKKAQVRRGRGPRMACVFGSLTGRVLGECAANELLAREHRRLMKKKFDMYFPK